MAGKALPSNLSYSIAYLASVGEVMSLGGVVVSWRICPGAAIVLACSEDLECSVEKPLLS